MSHCHCGNNESYSNCCQPIHQSHKNAQRPEQLMRARFSAHILGLVDFVIATYHPSCNAEKERDGIAESVHLNWTNLQVIDAPPPSNNEGFVEFKAFVEDQEEEHCMHERSRFLCEDGLWFYIDGTFPEDNVVEKVGRNDPCPCASGKKYKKCCGK